MGQESRVLFVSVFMVLTVITAIFVLLANVGVFGKEVMSSDFAKWGIGGVLAEIVAATVAAFRWEVLSSKNMLVIFDFKPELAAATKLDRCVYEIADENNNSVCKGETKIARDNVSGYWRCFIPLPPKMKYEHTTTLRITDNQGREYEVTDWILQHTLEVWT